MNRGLLAIVLLGWMGCSDRTRDPGSIVTPPPDDAGALVDADIDEPVRALCVPQSLRCLGENSPLFERCTAEGTGFERGSCDEEGRICREGACVPFTCVAGRALCVGPTTAATCDETGRAVHEVVECGGAEVCLGGACLDPCESASASRSYIGCEYVADELPNVHGNFGQSSAAPFGIVIANPAPLLSARVWITSTSGEELVALREKYVLEKTGLGGFGEDTELESLILRAGGLTTPFDEADVEVPPAAAAVFLPQGPGPYHVHSSRPVAAYQFGPYCCNFTATNDASLLLPVATWGTRYRVLGYPAWQSAVDAEYLQGYVRIVALEDVLITVESPVSLRWVERGTIGTNHTVELLAGGHATLETHVEHGEVPEEAGTDFSGALLQSSGPIGVFVGHPCTFVPQDQWACDHLEEALLPSETLGNRYVLSPVRRRSDDFSVKDEDTVSEATYWRIVADDSAEIRFSPSLEDLETLPPSNGSTPDCRALALADTVSLAPGETCEFGALEVVSVDSTGALVVGGVISGHQSTGVSSYGSQAGDPSLFLLGPVEQFRTDYSFVNPPTFKRTYVTVTVAPGAPVTLDGRAVPVSERLERADVMLGSERWASFTIALEPGAHSMASTAKFGIVVYAYDDYVSYAFTGGLDLLPKGAR